MTVDMHKTLASQQVEPNVTRAVVCDQHGFAVGVFIEHDNKIHMAVVGDSKFEDYLRMANFKGQAAQLSCIVAPQPLLIY